MLRQKTFAPCWCSPEHPRVYTNGHAARLDERTYIAVKSTNKSRALHDQ